MDIGKEEPWVGLRLVSKEKEADAMDWFRDSFVDLCAQYDTAKKHGIKPGGGGKLSKERGKAVIDECSDLEPICVSEEPAKKEIMNKISKKSRDVSKKQKGTTRVLDEYTDSENENDKTGSIYGSQTSNSETDDDSGFKILNQFLKKFKIFNLFELFRSTN